MKQLSLLILVFATLFSSCNNDEFYMGGGILHLDKDTLYFASKGGTDTITADQNFAFVYEQISQNENMGYIVGIVGEIDTSTVKIYTNNGEPYKIENDWLTITKDEKDKKRLIITTSTNPNNHVRSLKIVVREGNSFSYFFIEQSSNDDNYISEQEASEMALSFLNDFNKNNTTRSSVKYEIESVQSLMKNTNTRSSQEGNKNIVYSVNLKGGGYTIV